MEADAKLEKKLSKVLPAVFLEGAKGMSDDELRSVVSQVAIQRAAVEEAQSADKDIENARATLADLNAPYREALQELKAKIQYCRYLLQLRGKA